MIIGDIGADDYQDIAANDYWDIAAGDYWDIGANGCGQKFWSKQAQKHVFG